MKLVFKRLKIIDVKIKKPGTPRAFVFDVEVGVGKAGSPVVDPLSGMLLNLVAVDAVLAELRGFWSSHSWDSVEGLLLQSQKFLGERFAAYGCEAIELCLREKRGYWLVWRYGLATAAMGREEIREIKEGIWRLRWEKPFREDLFETQSSDFVGTAANPQWEDIFRSQPELLSLVVEDLVGGETWSYSR